MQPQPVRSCPMSNLFAPSFHITPFIGMSTKIIHDALPKCERYANITKYGFPVMVEPSPRDRPLESQQCDIKYIIVNLARQAHAERAHAERGVLTRFRNLCLALCRRLLWTSAPCGCCVPVVPRWDGYGRVVVFPNWASTSTRDRRGTSAYTSSYLETRTSRSIPLRAYRFHTTAGASDHAPQVQNLAGESAHG